MISLFPKEGLVHHIVRGRSKNTSIGHGLREREIERDEEEGLRNEIIWIRECVHTWVKTTLF